MVGAVVGGGGTARSRFLWLGVVHLAWTILGATQVDACRFNVRDVGFVDLDSENYELRVSLSETLDAATRTQIRNIGLATLLDSNVQLSIEPGSPVSAQAPVSLTLVGPDDRELSIPMGPEDADMEDQLWDTLESICSSPQRDAIFDSILTCYGAVVLVDGLDDEENLRVWSAIGSAMVPVSAAVRDQTLEKAIDAPPTRFRVPHAAKSAERVFLWSLGVDLESTEPQVVAVYARGRRIGQPLVGDEITQKSIFGVLSTIGLSCECGLDRSWMQGPMIPLVWDRATRETVAEKLAFDPENPAIKLEMSQILSKSALARGEGEDPTRVSISAETLVAGYSEIGGGGVTDQATPREEASVGAVAEEKTIPSQSDSAATEMEEADDPRQLPWASFVGIAALVFACGLAMLWRSHSRGL